MKPNLSADFTLPEWVPDVVRLYLNHTDEGIPIRELARREGTHASTVMRRVRKYEMKREDPLVDEALEALTSRPVQLNQKEADNMTISLRLNNMQIDDATLRSEGRRVLRRLCEPGAVLVVSPEMEKAVVTRTLPNGETARSCVLDRVVAQAFALKDWIGCSKRGRILVYQITTAGRGALKRMLAEVEGASANKGPGLAEAQSPFGEQHRSWDERHVAEGGETRRVRYNSAESPVTVLARKRDRDGNPFLTIDHVQAAERLREDFELAQMGPRITQNWEKFLTGNDRGSFKGGGGLAQGPGLARDRVAAALAELGPGLGDVALRVCCFLEGIEMTEKNMGWAARSGKIVLKIALERLVRHYAEVRNPRDNMVG